MNICVFGASSALIDPAYFAAAEELGSLLAQNGHRLIFGGGRDGLMGACARGVLKQGGQPLGVAPRFFDEPGVLMTEECAFIFTDTMSERKRIMEDNADAFIALPGGIGTYEEFFETLTLKQLGRHSKPMALLNTLGYFDPFHTLLQFTAASRFMSADVLSLYALCDSPAQALLHVETPSAPAAPRDISRYNR
ncbi:MAG: TIGR00730 family Rossman fold protein [Oscillospiraceae bacterium]|nr:TIGR00730 family Rossman fold protein [Oscillospiraceae bacterium]